MGGEKMIIGEVSANFQDSVEKTIPYIDLFISWVERIPNIKSVRKADLADDYKGIDYVLTDKSGKELKCQLKIEFKTDETRNIPIETISQAYPHKNSKIGAEFGYEEVDYIFYFLAFSGRVLMFKVSELLEYAINPENFKRFKQRSTKNENNGNVYHTLYFLVPLVDIKHLIKYERTVKSIK